MVYLIRVVLIPYKIHNLTINQAVCFLFITVKISCKTFSKSIALISIIDIQVEYIDKVKTTSLSVAIKRGTKECSSHASRG